MTTRRNFVKKAVAGTALAGILPLAKQANAGEVEITGTLVHHVFFWMKEPDNKEHRKSIEKGMKELLKIETIQMSHVGVPATTKDRAVVDHSYDYSYMVFFKDKKGHDIYQAHPLHTKFVKENSDLLEKVIVYDSVDLK